MKHYEKITEAVRTCMDLAGRGESVVEHGWVQLTMSRAKTHYRNGVYFSELDEATVNEKLEETIAHYNSVECPFRWVVGPTTTPENMKDILLDRGFEFFENQLGLALEIKDFNFSADPSIEIQEVTLDNYWDWLDCNSFGWSHPPGAKERFAKEVEAELSREKQRTFYFMAVHEGKVVATSSYLQFENFVHLSGSVVLPEFRKKGFYRAMLDWRIKEASKKGIEVVTISAVEKTSAPICMALGFKKECTFSVYVYEKEFQSPNIKN